MASNRPAIDMSASPLSHINPARSDRDLSPQEIDAFGAELEALRARVEADIGETDARYIRRVRNVVRFTEVLGRGLLFFGWFPPTWLLGTFILGISKILENMELGHNVMHGQYNWMNDPAFNGRNFEWDIVCPSEFWRHTHNHVHHTYTNVIGKDDDVGYGLARLFPEQRWKPFYRWQMVWVSLQAIFFEWAVAIQDLRLDKYFKGRPIPGFKEKMAAFRRKAMRQVLRDYVVIPLLALSHFWAVLAGNFVANIMRNVWTFAVIFCGHFTEKTAVFPAESLKGETQGQWYLRQLKGSSNLTGSKLLHIMTGNLSHQIEHHLFPTIPARRYAAIAVEVRALCEKYGQTYNTGTMAGQFSTVVARLWKYRKPDGARRMASAAA
jgi:fatty acid desaturase